MKALSWVWAIGKALMEHKLLQLFVDIFHYATPECPNLVEINMTGDQRYLYTREPEQIKALLTGKFAEYGKGEEFHRVWKPFLGHVNQK
jgi:hypothetical protein